VSAPERVNTTELGFQGRPDIVRLRGGGYVIAWASLPNTTGIGPYDVCFQLYDSSVAGVGANACINGAHQHTSGPFVKARADGGFTIAWNEADSSLDLSGMRWQDFDAAANPQGAIQSGPLPITLTAAPLAGGGYVKLLFTQGDSPSISFQLYAADGTPLGAPKPVGDTGGVGGQVVGLAGGGLAVAWWSQLPDVSSPMTTRAFSADGTPLGDALAIAPNTLGPVGCGKYVATTCGPWQNLSGIIAMDDGGYTISWMDGTGVATSGDTFARRFRADGSAAAAVIGRIGEGIIAPMAATAPDAFVMVVDAPDSSASGVGLLRIDSTPLR
jgi:hypothetical protein